MFSKVAELFVPSNTEVRCFHFSGAEFENKSFFRDISLEGSPEVFQNSFSIEIKALNTVEFGEIISISPRCVVSNNCHKKHGIEIEFFGYKKGTVQKEAFKTEKKRKIAEESEGFAPEPTSDNSLLRNASPENANTDNAQEKTAKTQLSPIFSLEVNFKTRVGSATCTIVPKSVFTYYDNILMRVWNGYMPIIHDENIVCTRKTILDLCLLPRSEFNATLQGKYKVHREVLCLRSPVFAAAFETLMKENKTGNIDVVDGDGAPISEDMCKSLIALLYDPLCNFLIAKEVEKVLKKVSKMATEWSDWRKYTDFEKEDEWESIFYPKLNFNIVGEEPTEKRGCLVSHMLDASPAIKLLQIVHRYQIQYAVAEIQEQMVLTLRFENLTQFYAVAKLYNLPFLLHACADLSMQLFLKNQGQPEFHELLQQFIENTRKKEEKEEERKGEKGKEEEKEEE